ncbi:glycosyltransferase [Bacillus sp. JJ1764]|uniref:glycosyltransferase n=1 Tax=Bacillus sp. JJ1764 TaxID=3122964 RepID=UPI002FFE4459
MKNILFINDNFLVGGTNTSALTQINLLVEMGFKVTLWIVTGVYDEDMMNQIPKGVSVVCGGKIDRKLQIDTQIGRSKKFLKHPFRMIKRMSNKTKSSRANLKIRKVEKYGELEKYYSIVFYFDVPLITSYLNWIHRQVSCKKKILWLHTVYNNKTIMETFNLKDELSYKILTKFDSIFAVSEECKSGFLSFYKEKNISVEIIRLPIDVKKIKKLSLEVPTGFIENDLRLVTVGRIAYEKGIDRVINISKKLLDENLNFVWYLIGDGDMEEVIKSMIVEYGLQDSIKLLGRKSNPYPYLLNADIVVVPSRTESWGLVTNEAVILGKTIVATDVGGTREMLYSYPRGIVVNNNEDSILEGLKHGIQKLLVDNIKIEKSDSVEVESNESYINSDMKEILQKIECD